jgi:hypothetical protein
MEFAQTESIIRFVEMDVQPAHKIQLMPATIIDPFSITKRLLKVPRYLCKSSRIQGRKTCMKSIQVLQSANLKYRLPWPMRHIKIGMPRFQIDIWFLQEDNP